MLNKLYHPIMKSIFNSKLFWIVVAIAFPIAINFIVLCHTPCNIPVVEDNGQSHVWLTFFGSYAAALGSIVLGWLAYHQNKKLQELDEKRDNRAIYVELESYVNKSEKLHSFGNIAEICNYIEDGKLYKAKAYTLDYQTTLQEFSNNICKFLEDERIKVELKEYGNKLATMNDRLFEVTGECIAQINKAIDVNEKYIIDVQKLHNKLRDLYYAPVSDTLYVELLKSGNTALTKISKKLLPPTEK